jgi:hypothetical protein
MTADSPAVDPPYESDSALAAASGNTRRAEPAIRFPPHVLGKSDLPIA